MKLAILYRGPLSSCNYGCSYCPFAKRRERAADHRVDRQRLERFLDWVEAQQDQHNISILFTPWGEALMHQRYQQAFVRLTHLPHVEKVSIQTNLSCRLSWVEDCDKRRMALWATYHPGEVARQQFLQRCHELIKRGVAFSVGIVGLREHAEEIETMRQELPESVYLWINAYKRIPDYYTPTDLKRFEAVDPLFPFNNVHHPSRGKACCAGETVISVDGEGAIRRCHFIREPIGNLYTPDWESALRPRLCTNAGCGCHIGYVHMPHLGLDKVFAEGILERIPKGNHQQ